MKRGGLAIGGGDYYHIVEEVWRELENDFG